MTVGAGAAWLLAAVLAVAAGAKLVRGGAATGQELAALGLAAPRTLARLVPVIELVTAAVLVAAPAWGGILAFALLAAFTVVLVRVLRSGRVVACNCFGGLSNRPISRWSVARNGALLALALVAAGSTG